MSKIPIVFFLKIHICAIMNSQNIFKLGDKTMVGDKIRSYREFRGLNQIQLAELSGINVGTIRKYELGIRNPKPDQLEKIASALGLNVSLFFDFKINTASDVLAILYALEDAVDISVFDMFENDDRFSNFVISFDNPTMKRFIKEWAEFKNAFERKQKNLRDISDWEEKQKAEEELNKEKEEWQLNSMLNDPDSSKIVKKGYDGKTVKIPSVLNLIDFNDLK